MNLILNSTKLKYHIDISAGMAWNCRFKLYIKLIKINSHLFSLLCHFSLNFFFYVRHHCCCCCCCCCSSSRSNRLVPPEYPLVLNRWGHQLNGTILGPMEEGDDIVLTCRVTGGKPRNSIPSHSYIFFISLLIHNCHCS